MRYNGFISPVIIGIGVVIAFVIVFIIAYLTVISKPAPKIPDASSLPDYQETNPITIKPTKTPKASSTASTSAQLGSSQQVQGQHISFSIPATWQVKQQHLPDNVELISATPDANSVTALSILIGNPQTIGLNNELTVYQNSQYQSETITINGQSAQKFSGVISTQSGALQETAVLMTKGNIGYVIKFIASQASGGNFDAVFATFTTSIKFNSLLN